MTFAVAILRVGFLLLPSISVPLLPAFELFLCSRHVAAATADDDDDDVVVAVVVVLPKFVPTAITISIILLIPSISFPPLPACELFLFSRHVVAVAVAMTAAPTAADDNDDDDDDDYADE